MAMNTLDVCKIIRYEVMNNSWIFSNGTFGQFVETVSYNKYWKIIVAPSFK